MPAFFADLVRETSSDLSLGELLEKPVTELIGVSDTAAAALAPLAIETIFDLGSSSVFARAAAAVAAADGDVRLVPRDLLGPSGADLDAAGIPELPLVRMHGLSQAVAAALTAALAVASIREFALWPPRRAAHAMVSAASGSDLGIDEAEAAAEQLRPSMGEYPTERVYYDTLFMLGTDAARNQQPLSQPLSLARLASGSLAFGAPAIGAVATYAQSWFAQGITLGHMVHSLALAPGEATRLAVIDWTRRTTATSSESIDESERLSNSTSHVRAISEVQNAVADEMQEGGSIATGWAKSSSKSKGIAGSVGGGIAGSIGSAVGALGFGGGGSATSQSSETRSEATSASWSVGSRSVLAEMNQRVNDRTEQNATSVRNRRATAVREVSQSEHEQVSTRIVANYNHMHALTVQYYEVVQIYRVAVELNRFDRALFLPFELLDFSAPGGADVVARFRGELLAGALTPRAAELLLDDRGRIEVRGAVRVPFPIRVADALDLAATATPATAAARAALRRTGAAALEEVVDEGAGVLAATAHVVPSRVVSKFTVVRPGPIAEVVPGDARVTSIAFDDVTVGRVRLDQPGVSAEASTFVVAAAEQQVDFPRGIPMRGLESISVGHDSGAAAEGSMVIRFESDGHAAIAVVPVSLLATGAMQKVVIFHGDAADRRGELLEHLQANRSHYTRVVLGRLDAASLALLLADVSWLGRPLAEQVEPTPLAVSGNYLVLRAPAEAGDPSGLAAFPTWGDVLKDRGVDFTSQSTRLVPIPTAGVFAEAVLGRSNAAEKLDITRFWNWQDSPIPLQPPEISPVGTGSRATAEDLTPGALGAPVLNIATPTSVPDPAGLAAALGALANGSMFRDMAGLAGTQAAAQAASAGTLDAATEAGRIASTNFQAATTQATEMGKAAANMFSAIKTGEAEKGRAGGISGDGARINHGRDMDERGVPSGAGAGGRAAASGTGGGSSGGEAVGGAGDGDGGTAPDVMPGVGQFPRELAFADDAAAVSPDLLGATTAALGVPLIPASFGGGSASTSALATSAKALLDAMRADAKSAGVSLAGITLRPMVRHRNAATFEAVPYAAWTDDAKSIYVNTKLFQKTIASMISAGAAQIVAEDFVRGQAFVALLHELVHIGQAKTLTTRVPSFAQMVDFEVQAYTADVTWISTAANRQRMDNEFGWDATDCADQQAASDANRLVFQNIKNDPALTTEADYRAAMQAKQMLPAKLNGRTAYTSRALYQR